MKYLWLFTPMQLPTQGPEKNKLLLRNSNTVGIQKLTLQKPETFENRTFWRSDFKWPGFQMVGTIAKELWSRLFENRRKAPA